MAIPPKPLKVGPFLGINNKLPADQLTAPEAGDFVRDAVNVDLTDAGTIVRRRGAALVLAGARCRSLWGDGQAAYFADGVRLMRFDGTAAAQVGQVANPDAEVSFTVTPRGIAWTDNASLNLIDGAASRPLTVPAPNPEPAVATGGGGALLPGNYLVAFAHVTAMGERSVLVGFEPLDVPARGVIEIQLAGPAALDLQVFVSPVNGGQLFHEHTIPAGATSARLPLITSSGTPVSDEVEETMPPGTCVRLHRGRILTVAGNAIRYSQPYAYGIYRPAENYILLDGPVTLCEPVEGGLYLATAKKIWFAPGGDLSAASLVQVAPFGAVPGTCVAQPTALALWWFSDRGAVRASSTGELELKQDANIAFGAAASGAGLYREEGGFATFIASLRGQAPIRGASASRFTK